MEKAQILAETDGLTPGRALVIEEATRAPERFVIADAFAAAAGTPGSSDNPFPIEPPTPKAVAWVVVRSTPVRVGIPAWPKRDFR